MKIHFRTGGSSTDTIVSKARKGKKSLRIPEIFIGSIESEEVPDQYFEHLTGDGKPVVGRERGYLYLSRLGFEHYKNELCFAYEASGQVDWPRFVILAELDFAKRAELLQKEFAETEKRLEMIQAVQAKRGLEPAGNFT